MTVREFQSLFLLIKYWLVIFSNITYNVSTQGVDEHMITYTIICQIANMDFQHKEMSLDTDHYIQIPLLLSQPILRNCL